MGHRDRRSRELVGLMKTATWWQRLRVLLVYANTPRPPWRMQGLSAWRWVFSGQVPRRSYGKR